VPDFAAPDTKAETARVLDELGPAKEDSGFVAQCSSSRLACPTFRPDGHEQLVGKQLDIGDQVGPLARRGPQPAGLG